MKGTWTGLLVFAGLMGAVTSARGDEAAEACFRNLPPGCRLVESFVAPRNQTAAVGRKLGAEIRKLSNTVLMVHGGRIQVNILDASTDAGAAALHRAISGMKADPAFCLRVGKRVIEYVGGDPALATKTSYELGFLPKPRQIRYRIVAKMATVDRADYMAFNEFSNLFFATDAKAPSKESASQIAALSRRFRFGRSVTLRTAGLGRAKSTHSFIPVPDRRRAARHGETMTYSFRRPATVLGVPYITATMDITADDTGVTPTARKADGRLLSSTEFWPSDDPDIAALAGRITAGRSTPEAKVRAILRWLAPGRNITFGGPVTGSRWGVKKVLKQQYGQCWDFADCFVTLCRASGIPCRQVGGWLYGTSGHIWAEVLIEGTGWQQVDATGGGKLDCGIYHIPYFVTESGDMPILYVAMPRIEILETKP